MSKEHFYNLSIKWTGNKDDGTTNYRTYDRSYTISGENKEELFASSDPAYRGDKTKYNPEELLVAAISGCHMLWFLHLCSVNGVIVVDYMDNPTGTLEVDETGAGQMKEVTLNPVATVTHASMTDKLEDLHNQANKLCFIARSVNFPVHHKSDFKVKEL